MNLEKTTKNLIEFKTVEGNAREVEKCLKHIQSSLPKDFQFEMYENKGEKSLLVTKSQNPQILLHGHIDVVKAEEELFQPEIRDGKIYGRGAADMKSGVACLMKVLKEVDTPKIGLLITSDEERGGFNGTGHVIDEADLNPNFVISGEPDDSGNFPSIVTKQKGVLQIKISTQGKSAHASKPEKGENAAEKLFHKYQEIRELFNHETEFPTTINLGKASVKGPVNKIPKTASLSLDIRYSQQYPKKDILEDLEEIPDIDFEILAQAPMLETPQDNPNIQCLKQSAQEVVAEKQARFRRENFASDMRFFTEKGIPAVCFGPEGYHIHGENEYVEKESMKLYCEILKNFLERLDL